MANVLVVEDDMALQEAYCFMLRTVGHQVDGAYDGQEGLDRALKVDYDLILLDLHMPVKDGWAFLGEYKQHGKKTKIIVFSNMVEAETERRAADLGAYQCILKSSMTPSEMLSLVDKETK